MTTKTRKLANIGNDHFETLAGGPLSGLRNVIINGNFDIWQRGTSLSSGTGSRYISDRWFTSSIGTTYTISRQAFTLGQTDVPYEPAYFHRTVVTSVAGVNNYCELVQYIEDVRTLANQYATISFYAKADSSKIIATELFQYFGTGGSPSANVGGIGVTKFNLNTSWQKFTLSVLVPSISGKTLGTNNNHALSINFWFDAGSTYNSRTNTLGQQSGTFDIAQVQIEPGNQATPFEQRHIGLEMMLCQRYYEKSYSLNVVPGTVDGSSVLIALDTGMTSSLHLGLINFNFSTPKRIVPTMTYYSPQTGASGFLRDYSQGVDLAIAGSEIGGNGGRFWAIQTANTSSTNMQVNYTADAEIL